MQGYKSVGIILLTWCCLLVFPLRAKACETQLQIDSLQFYSEKNDFQKVLRIQKEIAGCYGENAQDIKQWLKWNLAAVKTIAMNLGDLEQAAHLLDSVWENRFCEPEAQDECEEAGRFYMWSGAIRVNQNRYLVAKNAYEKSLFYFSQAGVQNPYVAGNVLLPLGSIYTRLGDYEKASTYLRKAIDICKTQNDRKYLPKILNDYGILLKEYSSEDEARKIFLEGLAIAPENSQIRGELLLNLGYLEIDDSAKKNIEQGGGYIQQAIEIFGRIAQFNSSDAIQIKLAESNRAMAEYFEIKKEYASAIHHFNRAIAILTSITENPPHREIAKAHILFGDFWVDLGQSEKALEEYQMALKAVLPQFHPALLTDNPNENLLYPENSILEALSGKADALQLRFQHSEKHCDLIIALECHELAGKVEDLLQDAYIQEGSRKIMAANRHKRAEHIMEITFQLWEDLKELRYVQIAFDWMERTKGALLRERIATQNIAKESSGLAILKQRLRKYSVQISMLQEIETEQLKNEDIECIAQLQDSISFTINQLKTDFPHFYSIIYNHKPIDIPEFQALLKMENQTALEFFMGDSNAYIGLLDGDEFGYFRIGNADSIRHWANEFWAGMDSMKLDLKADYRSGAKKYAAAAVKICQSIAMAISGKNITIHKRLVIIPDGEIAKISFAALLPFMPSNPNDFSNYPYLMRLFTFCYGYSATLFHQQNTVALNAETLFSISGFNIDQDENPANSMRIKFIKHLASIANAHIYSGVNTTKAQFTREAAKSTVVFLLGHSPAIQPGKESGIEFSSGEILYDWELYEQLFFMNAKLMVMLSCQWNNGEIASGEGLQSKSMALFSAGCPSVISSNLEVRNDFFCDQGIAISSAIMAGKTKDEAVQKAYQAVLEGNEGIDVAKKRPSNWATLAVWGDARPLMIESSKGNSRNMYILFAALLISGIFFYRRFSRRPKQLPG